jgi:hypothetical protein
MGVVPTLFAVRGTLPLLVAMGLSGAIGITAILAERARRANRLDRRFAASALALVLSLVATVFWLSQHGPGRPSTSSVEVAYRIDPRLESPPPVAGLALEPGDIVHIVKKSGVWGCDRSGKMNLGLGGLRNPPGDPATFLVPLAPLCSLVIRIGDGRWAFIGDAERFPVAASGSLFLTANDVAIDSCDAGVNYGMGCYDDNTGGISVNIRVERKSV